MKPTIKHDEHGETYIRFQKMGIRVKKTLAIGRAHRSQSVLVDYDSSGRVVGIEVIAGILLEERAREKAIKE